MNATVALLRAMAAGSHYKDLKHDIILNAGADDLERLRAIIAELHASLRMMEAAKERAEAINAELLTALKRMRGITHQHISPACQAADEAIAQAEAAGIKVSA